MKIGIITNGLTGILYSSFELIARLEKEGHELIYLCPWDIEEKVRNNGIAFLKLPETNLYFKNPFFKSNSARAFPQRLKYRFSGRSGYQNRKQLLNIDAYEEFFTANRFDHVIVDIQLLEIVFCLYGLGMSYTLLSPWFCMRKTNRTPPIRSAVIPHQQAFIRNLQLNVAWLRHGFKIYARRLFERLLLMDFRRRTIRRYAREVGFPATRLLARTFPAYYIFRQTPILSLTLKELEFDPRMPPNLFHVGPMVRRNRVEIFKDEEVLKQLSYLFERKRTGHKKLVYCSVSSMVRGDVDFLKKVLLAVKGQSSWMLILGLGGHTEKEVLGPLPENAWAFDWVPQLRVLASSDCNINHAGINTVNECIEFNVPMLTYSGKMADQDGTAARIHHYGAGIMADKDKDSPIEIREKILELLNNPMYRERMSELHRVNTTYASRGISELLQFQ